MTPLLSFGGGDGWLAPGENGYLYLGTGGLERGLGYGNGHLYLVSRNGGNSIRILDPITGTELGSLNTNGISGGIFAVNLIAVDATGIIYVGNLTTDATTTPFKVYQWTNETAVPNLVYNGTPIPGGRVGDSMAIIGGGSSARLAVGFNTTPVVPGNNGYALINPVAGTSTQVTFASTPPNSGDFRAGLTFTDVNHVWGAGGGPTTWRYAGHSGGSGTLITSRSADPLRLLGYAVVGASPLFVAQNITSSTVNLYDANDPANPVFLTSGKNSSGTLTVNSVSSGQIVWGDFSAGSAKLYAMSANQGIQAFVVTGPPRPQLTFSRFTNKLVLAWPTNANGFNLESATNVESTTWSPAAIAPVVVDTNYVVTNTIGETPSFFRLKK